MKNCLSFRDDQAPITVELKYEPEYDLTHPFLIQVTDGERRMSRAEARLMGLWLLKQTGRGKKKGKRRGKA